MPELSKMTDDELHVSASVSQAGVFFRKEGCRFNLEEKRDLVLELENKSTREVDRILISKSDNPEIHFKESIKPKTEEVTEVRLHFDQETMEALERLKEIWSHADPHSLRKKTPAPESKAAMKREVWQRDQAQSTFTDPRTGERCGSKHFLEEDHIIPKAKGGPDTVENLRLRCRAHNQRHAIDTYGARKMSEHLKAARF